jgi:hypothetical protein
MMRRREFIALLGGAAAAWPRAGQAQQLERMRRIGVLLPASADDPDYQTRVSALAQGLALLGWNIGRNIRIDIRWARGDPEQLRRYAEELVALRPDVLLASSSLAGAALQQATRAVPIVFGALVHPVGAGFVASLSHPGGNTTGFTNFEYSLSGKWLELLKEILPSMTPTNFSGARPRQAGNTPTRLYARRTCRGISAKCCNLPRDRAHALCGISSRMSEMGCRDGHGRGAEIHTSHSRPRCPPPRAASLRR